MEYLKDLISIISKNKVKHIEIISNDLTKDRKLYKLYDGILNEEFSSDGQACRKLYGTNNLNKGYRNLKSRLEKRALNTLFFIDLNSPSYTDFQKAYYNCYKNLAATKVLLGRGAKQAGIKLSEKTLNIVLKFELYDIATSSSKSKKIETMKNLQEKGMILYLAILFILKLPSLFI